MDFFEAQAHAKKRTVRLVWLFILAVAGTIALTYVVAVIAANAAQDRGGHRHHREYRNGRTVWVREDALAEPMLLWQPHIFFWTASTTLAVVGLASLIKWGQYAAGGAAVAKSVGARPVDPHSTALPERRLLNVVEEMAIASGVPVPAVYLLEDENAINAFAAGLTTSDAAVCVTRGTMEKLTRDELQGVIAHEFSHILNGDMRLNLRIGAIVFGILVIGLIGRGLLVGAREIVGGRNTAAIAIGLFCVGLSLLIVGYIGYFFGRLIQAAVSRQREFLADASAVQFTRNPGGIAGALKKIGGYALGSVVTSRKSGEISHFFFAQAFRSGLTGWWATHPPLEERIRAIDPSFDGKYFEPAERVDVAHESFVTAGLTGSTQPARPQPPKLPPATAMAAVLSAGSLTPEQIENAQSLLDATPTRLRDAARSQTEAPVLVFGLLLADEPAARARQREIAAQRCAPDVLQVLDELMPALATVRDEQRLPLLQLALPALRGIAPGSLDKFLDTLDELVHADGQISTFEFALQRMLTRTLELGRAPTSAVVQYYSFNAVVDQIAVVLSALAHAATAEPAFAQQAFAAGAAQLKLIESQLQYRDAAGSDLVALDAALDKLARASGPIKHRTLVAAAQVVTADGRLLVCEAELLRAISAALDVPMPPLQMQVPQAA